MSNEYIIPKIIHYCWLSCDPFPKKIQYCINSWKKHCPDYEFIHWDLKKFPLDKSIWVKEAYEQKKYAFAADYIRLYALYNFGGIYLDTDVEVIKSFDELLKYPQILCYENSISKGLEVAAFGVPPQCNWVKKCLEYYENRHFIQEDGSYDSTPLPQVVKKCLLEHNYRLLNISCPEDNSKVSDETDIAVLPYHYFSPKSLITGELALSQNTYSIHHFAGSWLTPMQKFYLQVRDMFGFKTANLISKAIKFIIRK